MKTNEPFYVEDDYVYASVADRICGRRREDSLNRSLAYFRVTGRAKAFVDAYAREYLHAEHQGNELPHHRAAAAALNAEFFTAEPLRQLAAYPAAPVEDSLPF